MIAFLPMYDLPWLNQANDRLWTSLAARLQARGIQGVPLTLQRSDDLDAIWTAPGLLLGQTCGYPLLTLLRGRVRLVATPHYDARGCEGSSHRAAILVRQDDPASSLADLAGRTAGVNGYDSNTGMNLFRAAVAAVADGPDFFASVVRTGTHANSFASLISGEIDVASIDAVTLALLGDRYPDQATRLRVLEWTAASPALPLITSIHTPDAVVAALQEELQATAHDPALGGTLKALRIKAFSMEPLESYNRIIALENQAIEFGYPIFR